MKRLMIENAGEADIRAFTILGLSSSRDSEEKIGQFGSGAKHAINLLLREGLEPTIYSGENKYDFTFQLDSMNGTRYNQVYCNDQKTGWALEFGAIDWTDIRMALREFISNALDASDEIDIRIVDSVEPKAGTTRIFIPVNQSIKLYLADIGRYFLHFGVGVDSTLIKNPTKTQARIYRKGVWVRDVCDDENSSLFNYNFGSEVVIDESRNMSDYDAKCAAARMLSQDEEGLRIAFESFSGTEKKWEHCFSYYHLQTYRSKERWTSAWEKAHGDKVAVKDTFSAERVIRKGRIPIILPTEWHRCAKEVGIPTEYSVMSSVEAQGMEIVSVPDECRIIFDKIWDLISELNLTRNKNKPRLGCFSKPMDCSNELIGMYKNGVVYANVDYCTNTSMLIEEISHYITESKDFTRDFQDFAFKLSARLMEFLI